MENGRKRLGPGLGQPWLAAPVAASTRERFEEIPDFVLNPARTGDGLGDFRAQQISVALAQPVHDHLRRAHASLTRGSVARKLGTVFEKNIRDARIQKARVAIRRSSH